MTVLPDQVDVLIVGYGPVGAAIAGLLGRYGVRTLVVDRLPGIWMTPRAIALDNEALRILQMVGLPEDAFAKVVIPQVRMHSPHFGEFARINTRGTIDGHPKLVTFYQPELERALRAYAEGQPSVTARTGVEMVRFEEDGDGVRVAVRTSAGVEAVVRARYLVGADGASSNVRAAIGLDFEGETYGADWLIVDAAGVPDNIDHIEFLCNPDRPTPHMVAPGGRTRWEFMLKPGETREEMETDGAIARLLEPWAKADEIEIRAKGRVPVPRARVQALPQGARLPRRRCGPPDAPVRRPGAGGRAARRREPGVEARMGRAGARIRGDPRHLRSGATPARREDDPPRQVHGAAHHAARPRPCGARPR